MYYVLVNQKIKINLRTNQICCLVNPTIISLPKKLHSLFQNQQKPKIFLVNSRLYHDHIKQEKVAQKIMPFYTKFRILERAKIFTTNRDLY